ncbi:hypothetical protein EZI54_17380 [Marinobacter halodurans]|uniref:DUF3887 domain-containing protein n=1 Tax=Marinobacter halodurans TaxID=2528979 RepID=A0ABY1ZJE7_9GAMM|nr:hypothetical protein [Marinobacter halodurans]TBW51293.1 hypothetical protein EZI54_17380 [Marinobacter halodurans]
MQRLAYAMAMVLTLAASGVLAESRPDAATDALLNSQLEAIAADDYAGFVDRADAHFRQTLGEDQFHAVAQALAGPLNAGYDTEYLGSLNQAGLKVYLWKIVYSEKKDDNLIKMALRDDEIAGFWIQ